MSIFSTIDLNPRPQPNRKKYYPKEHVIFQKSRRSMAITIDPQVADRFGLVPGLDIAHYTIEGDKVILRFSRRGSAFEE